MGRIDVKQRDCPVTPICARVGDHSHFTCDECGAPDYTGLSCLTCLTLRRVQIVGVAHGWDAA
jgi:hypothetical protein